MAAALDEEDNAMMAVSIEVDKDRDKRANLGTLHDLWHPGMLVIDGGISVCGLFSVITQDHTS